MANTLSCIIEAVFSTYPRNTIWLLLNTLDGRTPLLTDRINTILGRVKVGGASWFDGNNILLLGK
jgi:hypothetical protein